MPGTIAVQAFNKADSVLRTLDSIAKCRGSSNYNLLILQDGCAGAKFPKNLLSTTAKSGTRSDQTESYYEAWNKTTGAVDSWRENNRDHFRSLRFDRAEVNHGPYATAERLIDWAFATSNSVIFSEDDLVFEQDAVEWFEDALAHPMFLSPDVWAIAGESKFFDSQQHVPSDADISRALDVAHTHGLKDRFVYFDFIPSSCFATTREKWAEFGETRGATNGDRAVVERCRAEAKLCLWPVIARCRDIGMHDPLGYSVRWKGPNHPVFKNSYIVSGMLEDASRDLREVTAGKEALFGEFAPAWVKSSELRISLLK
jgi:hypothetical protein